MCAMGTDAERQANGANIPEGASWHCTDTGKLWVWNGASWTEIGAAGGGAHAITHQNGGSDEISVSGLSGTLADPQTPATHAASHKSAGADAIKLDELAAPTDVTTLDADTTKHGLMKKFPGGTTNFLRADGSFAAPPGGGGEAFPVGSVFIAVVSTNPGTLLGYGTWVAFAAGRVLVGFDAGQVEFDTVEETGGEKTHTLTVAEMPAHDHDQMRHVTATGALSGITTAPDTSSSSPGVLGPKTGSTGGGGAHNNLQPYIVVYMWKRTA